MRVDLVDKGSDWRVERTFRRLVEFCERVFLRDVKGELLLGGWALGSHLEAVEIGSASLAHGPPRSPLTRRLIGSSPRPPSRRGHGAQAELLAVPDSGMLSQGIMLESARSHKTISTCKRKMPE